MSAIQGTPAPPDTFSNLSALVQNLQEELLACQRLALLGNMTAMIAHEYNNLLTPVAVRAEAALLSPDDGEFVRRSLEQIRRQARRAIVVSERLLQLAHQRERPTESCSVAVAVRAALETMPRPLEKDGIALHVSVPEDLWVAAREELLSQLLLNLLLNARRAMEQQRTGTLSVQATLSGENVQIDVRDTGCGVARDLLENVFNPFLAADPFENSTDWQRVGLGLSVCRMIAHHHGARIQGLANEDRGCTFRLCWPAAANGPNTPTASC
jgi:C4-dicarboxylate-specific signal transduction histidine kinase